MQENVYGGLYSFDFQVFQALETLGKRLISWKTPGIFIKYSWDFPDFSTLTLLP
jgi:hypothetical protein